MVSQPPSCPSLLHRPPRLPRRHSPSTRKQKPSPRTATTRRSKDGRKQKGRKRRKMGREAEEKEEMAGTGLTALPQQ
jgi:hypothetical protein